MIVFFPLITLLRSLAITSQGELDAGQRGHQTKNSLLLFLSLRNRSCSFAFSRRARSGRGARGTRSLERVFRASRPLCASIKNARKQRLLCRLTFPFKRCHAHRAVFERLGRETLETMTSASEKTIYLRRFSWVHCSRQLGRKIRDCLQSTETWK